LSLNFNKIQFKIKCLFGKYMHSVYYGKKNTHIITWCNYFICTSVLNF